MYDTKALWAGEYGQRHRVGRALECGFDQSGTVVMGQGVYTP